MLVVLGAVFGGLTVLTLLICVAMGIAAARADRASDASLQAMGIEVMGQAEALAVYASEARAADVQFGDAAIAAASGAPSIAT